MEYHFVKGFREGAELLYVASEKCLYRFKRRRNKAKDFVCYQTLLSKPTKRERRRNEDQCSCGGSVRLLPDGSLKIMNGHTDHNHHESIMKDMEKANNMKEKCKTLKNDFPQDSHKISSRNIFQGEIVKYVYRLSVRPSIHRSVYF